MKACFSRVLTRTEIAGPLLTGQGYERPSLGRQLSSGRRSGAGVAAADPDALARSASLCRAVRATGTPRRPNWTYQPAELSPAANQLALSTGRLQTVARCRHAVEAVCDLEPAS
eukprot:365387-Chlamydomonas_euryale.AAC.5